jgi:hypothetical protein
MANLRSNSVRVWHSEQIRGAKMRVLTIVAVAAIAAAAPWSRPAQAAATFDWNATCVANCSGVGLNAGDPMSGWFSFNDAAIVPNGGVGTADVVDFDLNFGAFHLTLGTAAFLFFQGFLNGTATAFDDFPFLASEAISPGSGDTIENIAIFGAGLGGNCFDATCSGGYMIANTAGFDRQTDSLVLRQIPEPGALTLLGSGLAGLAWVRRQRRR